MHPKLTKSTVGGEDRPENFPVASVLLRRHDRQAVMAFYDFARFADDIADAPHISATDKIDALNDLDAALYGSITTSRLVDLTPAIQLREQLFQRGITPQHASELLIAFRQDAENINTDTWQSLMEYCRYSAAPVGRFLLDLHNEPKDALAASDALCAALQVLNHIQDIGEDYQDRHRRYLPLYWPDGTHAEVIDLTANRCSPQLRKCIDHALQHTQDLLRQADQLPKRIQSRRLRAEAVAILSLAHALHSALQDKDPLAARVRPSKSDGWQAAKAAIGSLFWPVVNQLLPPVACASITQIVEASGSSFRHGMRSLPRARREAMYTVYAFCRVIDDIADDEGLSVETRLASLEDWEGILLAIENNQPPHIVTPLIEAMVAVHDHFGLNIDECRALIAGMRMDIQGPVFRPTDAEFVLYCRRVAVSVGLLCLPIMGANDPQAVTFAHELGHALQCVNIIRDVAEDAALGRCYLPDELLEAHGITAICPMAIANHPNIGQVRAELAKRATQHFHNAHKALTPNNVKALRPARLMMVGYRDILERMEAAGFDNLNKPAKLPRWKKFLLLGKIPKPLSAAQRLHNKPHGGDKA